MDKPETILTVTVRKVIASMEEGEKIFEQIRMEFFDDKTVQVHGQTSTHFKPEPL